MGVLLSDAMVDFCINYMCVCALLSNNLAVIRLLCVLLAFAIACKKEVCKRENTYVCRRIAIYVRIVQFGSLMRFAVRISQPCQI